MNRTHTQSDDRTISFTANAGVLLVDDEAGFLRSARVALASAGIHDIELISDSRQVLPRLRERRFAVVTLDITMPHLSGIELLNTIIQEYPSVTVIMITGHNEVETAVSCLRSGAYDYLLKPLSRDDLAFRVKRALNHRQAEQEAATLKDYLITGTLRTPEAFEAIVTRSRRMLNLFEYAEAIAASSMPVLITGETGVGKELFARGIHAVRGKDKPFVAVNAAGLDDAMFSDTLFGHCKGAFTGASEERKGLIEQAGNGTLFLDEIGDLRPDSQIKLLRLLQEREYYPVGADAPRRSSARIIAATNQDISQKENFRRDLYYRLHAHRIDIPPLRERKEDIPLLARHFIEKAGAELGKPAPVTPREFDIALSACSFPGNVRELEALIYDALSVHAGGPLSPRAIRAKIGHTDSPNPQTDAGPEAVIFPDALPDLKTLERALFDEALRRANGNKSLAANMLGITRQTLNNRLRTTERQGV